jgi:hypothetical protein
MALKPLLPGESGRGVVERSETGVRGALRSVLNDRNIWAREKVQVIGAEYLGQTQHTPDQTGCFEECAE